MTPFATVNDPSGGNTSLWKTSAAPDGAAMPLGAHNPTGLIEVAGRYVFFGQQLSNFHYGLWTTDGTPAGTYAIVPDLGSLGGRHPTELVNAAGTVFFLQALDGQNVKLWKSDGTADGTTIVKELSVSSTFETQIVAAGRRAFFVINGSLWSSDGTESGTTELTKVSLADPLENDLLKSAGDRIVFVTFDQTTGYDLWSSDGTQSGTKPLLHLTQYSTVPVSIDGTVYFANTDNDHGNELWTTDGTVAGTKLLADLNPGPASSNPTSFTKAGNLVYFSAYTDAAGTELWALQFNTPAISISDLRAAEGDVGTSVAHFNVSLTPAATQTVTVDYVTSDGTATAGVDYDAVSGTLTFEPGETAKTIDVLVHGDVIPENNETFYVTLRNVSGAQVTRGEAVGIIEDDDQIADLGIAAQFGEGTTGLSLATNVSNSGPRTATDVAVAFTETPSGGFSSFLCTACSIPQLANGASAPTFSNYNLPALQQSYLSATVAARQRDPQPANNTIAWTLNGSGTMAMNAVFLTPGATATVTAKISTANPVVTSSDPTVVSAPSTLTKVTAGLGTFTVTGVKPGASSINVDAQQAPLLVTVVAPGTQPLWPGGVTVTTNFSATFFELPITATITPSGTAPLTGAKATGTVVVTAGGQALARGVVSGTGSALTLPFYLPSLGQIPFVITYSGDTNFQPQSVNGTVFIHQGDVTMTGGLERVPGSAGTFTLTVHATGSPLASPTGVLSVVNGGAQVAQVALVPSGGGTSIARATITNLPASPTLTINYPGDALYQSGSQQVRLVETRRRSAGH
ncbi:MAG TPA: ELWxxDGT repeat protein [Thermoanaerobaculia bacterium]|nr:ELWxxDGT repeat protein [Thermoanaerobaculia bacterium]